MTDPSPTFAEAFERLRLARGWTPAEVARRLGVYPTEVSRWRHGRGGISIRNVRKVADLYGVDHGDLERLAGYDDSSVDGTGDIISPELAALADAARSAFLRELDDIPPAFWDTILAAQHAALRIAAAAVHRAIELTSDTPPTQAAISTAASGEFPTKPIAKPEKRQKSKGGSRAANTPLVRLFQPAAAMLALS